MREKGINNVEWMTRKRMEKKNKTLVLERLVTTILYP